MDSRLVMKRICRCKKRKMKFGFAISSKKDEVHSAFLYLLASIHSLLADT